MALAETGEGRKRTECDLEYGTLAREAVQVINEAICDLHIGGSGQAEHFNRRADAWRSQDAPWWLRDRLRVERASRPF